MKSSVSLNQRIFFFLAESKLRLPFYSPHPSAQNRSLVSLSLSRGVTRPTNTHSRLFWPLATKLLRFVMSCAPSSDEGARFNALPRHRLTPVSRLFELTKGKRAPLAMKKALTTTTLQVDNTRSSESCDAVIKKMKSTSRRSRRTSAVRKLRTRHFI